MLPCHNLERWHAEFTGKPPDLFKWALQVIQGERRGGEEVSKVKESKKENHVEHIAKTRKPNTNGGPQGQTKNPGLTNSDL